MGRDDSQADAPSSPAFVRVLSADVGAKGDIGAQLRQEDRNMRSHGQMVPVGSSARGALLILLLCLVMIMLGVAVIFLAWKATG